MTFSNWCLYNISSASTLEEIDMKLQMSGYPKMCDLSSKDLFELFIMDVYGRTMIPIDLRMIGNWRERFPVVNAVLEGKFGSKLARKANIDKLNGSLFEYPAKIIMKCFFFEYLRRLKRTDRTLDPTIAPERLMSVDSFNGTIRDFMLGLSAYSIKEKENPMIFSIMPIF